MYDYGLTRERVLEYLGVIEELGHIEIDVDTDEIRRPII